MENFDTDFNALSQALRNHQQEVDEKIRTKSQELASFELYSQDKIRQYSDDLQAHKDRCEAEAMSVTAFTDQQIKHNSTWLEEETQVARDMYEAEKKSIAHEITVIRGKLSHEKKLVDKELRLYMQVETKKLSAKYRICEQSEKRQVDEELLAYKQAEKSKIEQELEAYRQAEKDKVEREVAAYRAKACVEEKSNTQDLEHKFSGPKSNQENELGLLLSKHAVTKTKGMSANATEDLVSCDLVDANASLAEDGFQDVDLDEYSLAATNATQSAACEVPANWAKHAETIEQMTQPKQSVTTTEASPNLEQIKKDFVSKCRAAKLPTTSISPFIKGIEADYVRAPSFFCCLTLTTFSGRLQQSRGTTVHPRLGFARKDLQAQVHW